MLETKLLQLEGPKQEQVPEDGAEQDAGDDEPDGTIKVDEGSQASL